MNRGERTALVVAVVVALMGAGALVGGRVLLGTAQRVNCGAPGGTALVLSAQALGAAPSATECLGLAVSRPAATAPPTTAAPAPEPAPPTPTVPYDQAERACDTQLGLRPKEPLAPSDPRLQQFRDCMQERGHWTPID
jgi:hypothetical protein